MPTDQTKDFVIVEISKDEYRVRNLVFGTALNVKILDVVSSKEHQITIRFLDDIPTLAPQEIRQVTPIPFQGEEPANEEVLLKKLSPSHIQFWGEGKYLEIKVEFQNVEMKKMSVTQRVAPGILHVVKTSLHVAT